MLKNDYSIFNLKHKILKLLKDLSNFLQACYVESQIYDVEPQGSYFNELSECSK